MPSRPVLGAAVADESSDEETTSATDSASTTSENDEWEYDEDEEGTTEMTSTEVWFSEEAGEGETTTSNLTSSGTEQTTDSTESSPRPGDTSYSLASLPSETSANPERCLRLPDKDLKYLVAARCYLTQEPVYRPKKRKLKVVRRLQLAPPQPGLPSYTELWREARRRRGGGRQEGDDEGAEEKAGVPPPLSAVFEEKLNFRPERSFQRF